MDVDVALRTRRTPRRLAACVSGLVLLAGVLTLTTGAAGAAGPAQPLPGLVGSAVAVSGSTVVDGAPVGRVVAACHRFSLIAAYELLVHPVNRRGVTGHGRGT
jgi:hypothetical protein